MYILKHSLLMCTIVLNTMQFLLTLLLCVGIVREKSLMSKAIVELRAKTVSEIY